MLTKNDSDTKLFAPYQLGRIALTNRVVMAPLTRNRAEPENIPSPLSVDYYAQRASAGLIVTEATQISQQGQGYQATPGIHSAEQVSGWKKVTEAVHARGGHIFAQIWHVGRISHVSLQPQGGAPVAPSALRAKTKTFVGGTFTDVSEPRMLERSEIAGILADYAQATRNAIEAGFDGVEIHAANGYLIDQFLRDGTNQRTDDYGGSIENRARFLLQVVDTVVDVAGKDRVGIRLSPVTPANDISDSNPQPLFDYVARELARRDIVYIHVVEGATGGDRNYKPFDYSSLRTLFGRTYIANNGYNRASAIEAMEHGRADLIAFGKPFISNPDLVERLRSDASLAEPDKSTFYGGDARGYTDYPSLGDVN